VTVAGFLGQGGPEELLSALARRYKMTKSPAGLTLIFGVGPADWNDKGLNHFGHEGMIKRVIGGYYGGSPLLANLIQQNKVEAYQVPLGSISRMIRAAAAKLTGHITKIGFGTVIDPKHGGGKLNNITTEDIVQEIEVPPSSAVFAGSN
jgi:propionate CoA-transferase